MSADLSKLQSAISEWQTQSKTKIYTRVLIELLAVVAIGAFCSDFSFVLLKSIKDSILNFFPSLAVEGAIIELGLKTMAVLFSVVAIESLIRLRLRLLQLAGDLRLIQQFNEAFENKENSLEDKKFMAVNFLAFTGLGTVFKLEKEGQALRTLDLNTKERSTLLNSNTYVSRFKEDRGLLLAALYILGVSMTFMLNPHRAGGPLLISYSIAFLIVGYGLFNSKIYGIKNIKETSDDFSNCVKYVLETLNEVETTTGKSETNLSAELTSMVQDKKESATFNTPSLYYRTKKKGILDKLGIADSSLREFFNFISFLALNTLMLWGCYINSLSAVKLSNEDIAYITPLMEQEFIKNRTWPWDFNVGLNNLTLKSKPYTIALTYPKKGVHFPEKSNKTCNDVYPGYTELAFDQTSMYSRLCVQPQLVTPISTLLNKHFSEIAPVKEIK